MLYLIICTTRIIYYWRIRDTLYNQPVNVSDDSNTKVTTIRSVGRNTSTVIEFLHTSNNTPSI